MIQQKQLASRQREKAYKQEVALQEAKRIRQWQRE